MDESDICLLFVSKDSVQSPAVIDEINMAKHKEIRDGDKFQFIPIFIDEFKRMNLSLSSQIRVEIFGDDSKVASKRIISMIEGVGNKPLMENLEMSYKLLNGQIFIKSERKISFPTILFQLKDLNSDGTGVSLSGGYTHNKGYKWKTKTIIEKYSNEMGGRKIFIKWVESDNLKYINPKKIIKINLSDIGISQEQIQLIWLADNFGDTYKLRLNERMNCNALNNSIDTELSWTPHFKAMELHNKGFEKLKIGIELKGDRRLKILKEAEKLIIKSLTKLDSMNTRLTLGSIYRYLGDYNKAILNLTLITEMDPSNYHAFNSLGNNFSDDNNFDYEKSLFFYNKSIEIKRDGHALRNRGNLFLKVKKFELALKDWEESYLIKNDNRLKEEIEWLKNKIKNNAF